MASERVMGATNVAQGSTVTARTVQDTRMMASVQIFELA